MKNKLVFISLILSIVLVICLAIFGVKIGKLEIPKLNIDKYILKESSSKALKVSVTKLYGPEIKFYSNKIDIDNNFETSIKGLYSIGDGGGLTRGLMMASCAGVQTARNICKK